MYIYTSSLTFFIGAKFTNKIKALSKPLLTLTVYKKYWEVIRKLRLKSTDSRFGVDKKKNVSYN